MYDAKDLLTEITIRNKRSTDEIVEEILNAVIRDMLNRRSLIGTIKYSVVCDFISARIPKTQNSYHADEIYQQSVPHYIL
ncbi:hypothetical protein AP1_0284 [Aeromonas phage AP1]|nr:hypothetical protein AP1_0284 [Aeromonas phage AP1]